LELSTRPYGTVLSARDLGQLQGIPYPFARGIVTALATHGFIVTRRGPQGGVALARPPSDLNVLDVVEAMEGPTNLNLCTRDPDYCSRSGACFMHQIWLQADEVLKGFLRSQDFASLAARRAHWPWSGAAHPHLEAHASVGPEQPEPGAAGAFELHTERGA
jgi:Rrf2 family protein